MVIWYVYPLWHVVSFRLIGEKHVRELRKYFRVYEIDELAFPHINPYVKAFVFLHPFFFVMSKFGKQVERKLTRFKALIGVDVADSDRISSLAVSMTNYATAMIVPSRFSREAYIRSGVRVPVHVVPHGLDKEWYTKPKDKPSFFRDLAEKKKKHSLKYLLFFLCHSDFRKGADLVIAFYSILRKERKDVVLVVKTMSPDGTFQDIVRSMGGVVVSGWLTEKQKMELYDICDMYLLFSRGGGFEQCGLEALAREEVVLAPRGGSWEEYMPGWGLVDSKPCEYVLKDNPIHNGRGVEVIVEKAVDKAHAILDNLDEYKGRVREHKRFLAEKFTWERVGEKLRDIVYMYSR